MNVLYNGYCQLAVSPLNLPKYLNTSPIRTENFISNAVLVHICSNLQHRID